MKRSILAGLIFAASSLLSQLVFPEERFVWEEIYQVEMISELGKKTKEPFKIEAFIDDEKNRLSLSFFTQNFDRKNWSKLEERIPAYQRYTQINHMSTRVIVIHPDNVEIDLVKESAYVIPQHKLEELSPIEEHPYMQFLFELAQKGLDWIVKDIGFKGAPKDLDRIVKYVENKEERYIKETEGDFPRNFTAEQVIPFPVLPGRTETARNYEIYFKTGLLKKDIPIYLTIKVGLGNPSISSTGTLNKYGELEGILISFKLNPTNKEAPKAVNKNEVKEQPKIAEQEPAEAVQPEIKTIEDYFPIGKELDKISPKRMDILRSTKSIDNYIRISNPTVFSPGQTRRIEPYMPELIQRGLGSFGILNEEGFLDQIGFLMEISQFRNGIPQEITVDTGYSSDMVIFGIKSGNTYIHFNSFIRYGAYFEKQLASKQQVLDYLDFLIEYTKRIDGRMIIDEDKKGLATMFNRNPEKLKDMINNPGKHGLYSTEEAIKYLFSSCYE